MPSHFTHFKRRARAATQATVEAVENRLAGLQLFVQRLGVLKPGRFTFDLTNRDERLRMINLLWHPEQYQEALHDNQCRANPELAQVLSAATGNTYSDAHRDDADYNFKRAGLLEGVFSTITRLRSQNLMPFSVVLLSVIAVMTHVPHFFADAVRSIFRGVLADTQWTKALIDEAVDHNPGPSYELLDGVGAAMLDNLSIQVDYQGVFTTDAHGS